VSNAHGFTLVEMLLSVSIITLLVGISVPVYASFVGRTWGVSVLSDRAVVIKGTTYATRDAAFDETIPFGGGVTSTANEITFAKLSGTPTTTGGVTVTQNSTNDTRTVNINAKGTVE
jgi:prepilin-type N-terminal cleavage/methylation domain-containing protein